MKNASLSELLKTLWKEGFFEAQRDLSEISKALAAKGIHCNLSSLNMALIRAMGVDGFLIRKNSAGRWRYAQKLPNSSPEGQRLELFERYDFHETIKKVSFKQFQDEYYKEAIQNAFVEVIDQVKIAAGHPKKVINSRNIDLDGDDLMNHVFGCDNQVPIIKFNDLKNSLDRAEQRGIMNLFKGVVGIRDKKAHINFHQKDPMITVEYLSLASLLMRLLNKAPDRTRSAGTG